MGINKENLLSDEHHASHFSCAICQDLSESPVTLACSHVFCEFCIGEYVASCVGIKILRRVRAELSRRAPRHRRDASSMAWRCRFLTARRSQDGRVIAEKFSEELSGAPDALVDFHTGEKSARLDAAQKEILAIGKERWVEKVEETRMIRKMAGLVALGMSLLTVFYAREILWLVRGSVKRPGQVKWLAAGGLAWAGATFVVLAVQCARSARGDAMLDHIKETIEAKAKRDRDAARNAV